MGQQIDSNIFRLGINKKWKTEFFEKKGYELPLYIFKDLEIKKYIERFLETQEILLHDYKQHYNNSTLTLYISYFVSSKFTIGRNDKVDKIVLTTNRSTSNKITKIYTAPIILKDSQKFLFDAQTPTDCYNMKKYLDLQLNFLNRKSKLTIPFNNLQENLANRKVKEVLAGFFKVLTLFTNNKYNIIINFCCLNKNLSFLKKTQKKNFILLQKFKETPFLKEGIELLFYCVYSNNSANLLAKFIAIQIKKVKRHKFFLSFLKQTLTILLNSNFSKVKGIKIIIKGRLNGLPRANHKTITIGDIPIQSICASIDHSQTTTQNSNGSYGIKVWIVEK